MTTKEELGTSDELQVLVSLCTAGEKNVMATQTLAIPYSLSDVHR